MNFDKKLMHRVFVLVAGSILFAWLILDTQRATALFQSTWQLFRPFVVGAGIAFIFNVPMRAVERQLDGIRKLGLKRILAIVLTILAFVLVIMFVIELLVPQLAQTADSLKATIPAFVERTANKLVQIMEENPEVKAWILEQTKMERLDWSSILTKLVTFFTNQVAALMGNAVNVISGLTSGIVNTVIALVFSIYCLSRKEILARQGRRIVYSILPEKWSDEVVRVLRLTNSTFSNFISGQCLEAIILGCLFAVSMAIFKMPYIPLVSVVIAVTALVPVVGAFVGCVVGAFFILVVDPFQALSFVVMFLVLQQVEGNLIYPRVVGTSVGLPGMWVLVAVTVGGELMGVGGMLVMIPMSSVLYKLAREFTDRRLAARGIPENKLMDQPPELKSKFQEKRERKERIRLQKMKEQFQAMQKKK